MSKTIEDLFYYIATYIPLLPSLVFLVFAIQFEKYRKNWVLKTVASYALLEFLTNFSTQFVTIQVTILFYALFTLLEYLLFARSFFLIIKSQVAKKGIVFLSLGFTVFWILYQIYGPKNVLDSVPIGVASILILIYAFYFFYEEMENVSQGPIYTRFTFWITAGIMVYLAGNFFLYVFSNQVDARTRHIFWMFGNLCAILKNIFFVISILAFWKKKSSKMPVNPRFSLL
ncbi:MAG: hypothetical protein EOO06_18940 [Chitinophagaceae bacterium]|nr:MAG: hypothetical protein EOO06_18940 [Chitinophagaceae bacterium]